MMAEYPTNETTMVHPQPNNSTNVVELPIVMVQDARPCSVETCSKKLGDNDCDELIWIYADIKGIKGRWVCKEHYQEVYHMYNDCPLVHGPTWWDKFQAYTINWNYYRRKCQCRNQSWK
jgi:hypothetical protein